MFYVREPKTKTLIPLEDAEIIAECPICGKTFPFPELWEFVADIDDFTTTDSVLCDACGTKTQNFRRCLLDAGLTKAFLDEHPAIINELVKATA